jgi:hypothetical protein
MALEFAGIRPSSQEQPDQSAECELQTAAPPQPEAALLKTVHRFKKIHLAFLNERLLALAGSEAGSPHSRAAAAAREGADWASTMGCCAVVESALPNKEAVSSLRWPINSTVSLTATRL